MHAARLPFTAHHCCCLMTMASSATSYPPPARSPIPLSSSAPRMIPMPSIIIDNGAARNQAPSTAAEPTIPAPQRDWTNMTRTIAHYERIEQIGEGTYGQVYRARCKDTDQIVALKKIRVHHGGYWGMPPTVIREIKILKRLRHPNLVQMVEVVSSKGVEHLDEDDEVDDKHKNSKNDRIVDAREGFKGNLFLVLEYVSHDLTGLMDVAYRFTEVQVKCIFKQLLEALCYMHEHKYIHRDIKSSNILIDHNFRVKLADFGLARSIEPPILDKIQDRGNTLELTNKVITLWYRPPEILLGATRYGTPVDVWSAGCILAELILGKPLFTGKTEMDQLQLIFDMMGTPTQETWDGFQDLKLLRTGEVTIETARKAKLRDKYQTKVSGPALNLLEKLLELDPRKRLTASRALNSRYFLADPKAPDQPEDLPPLHLEGGHFHEFQTKKKRREAKGVAEKAKEAALETGRSQKEAQEEYDEVYRGIMEKVGKEGLNAVAKSDDRKEDVDGQSKPGEKKERKKDRASREKDREVREKEREARRAERVKEKAERKEKQREDRDKDRANRKRPEKDDEDRPRDRKSDEERRKKRKKEYEARKNDGAVKTEDKSEKPRDDIKREQLMDTEPAPKAKKEFDIENEVNKEAVAEELVARRESPPRFKERNGVDHGVANPVKAEPKDEVDDRRPIDREERRSSRKRRDRSRDRSHSRDREHTSKERSRERRSSRDRDPERRSSRDRGGERRRSRERRRRSRDGGERDDRDRKRRSRDPEDADYPPPEWGRDRDRDMERRGRDRDPDWGRDRDRDWPRDRRTPPENFNGPPPPRDMDPRDDFGPRGHYGPSRGGPPPGRGGPPPDSRGRGPPPDARRGPPSGDFGIYGPASGDTPRNHYGESRHRDHPDGDRRRDRSPPRRGRGRDRR